MTGLQINIPQRIAYARIVLAVAMALSLLFSWRLWAFEHSFPGTRFLHVDERSFPLSFSLLVLAILALLSSLLFKWHRLLTALALSAICILVLLDANRLQEWLFVYAAMLAVLMLYNGRVDDPNRFTSYFILLQLIACSFYFFTGYHQLQEGFLENTLPEVLAPLRSSLSDRQYLFCLKAGRAIPVLIMLVSFGLFVAPVRYLGITVALLLHLGLVLLQFPLRSGDLAGYAFNIAMMPLILLLFSGKTKERYFSPTFVLQRPAFYLVVFLFGAMPFFNNSGRWPDAMSFNSYSGNSARARVHMPVAVYLNLPNYVKNFCRPAGEMINLDLERWSRYEYGIVYSQAASVLGDLEKKLEFWNRGPSHGAQLKLIPRRKLLVMR